MFKIDIKFIPNLLNLGNNLEKADWSNVFQYMVDKMTYSIERYAKQVTPVDTGRLRASIGGGSFKGGSFPRGYGITISPLKGVIGTDLKYAYFVHEGTKRMSPRPFMAHGVNFMIQSISGENINARLDDELRKALSQL